MAVTMALTKGRILKDTLPLLAAAGIEPSEDISRSRKLVFDTNVPGLRLIVIRGTDVPTYVQMGAADLGIAGKDMLLECGGNGMYEVLDLGIARCRLMTAVANDWQQPKGRMRVATKFVNVARDYYASRGKQVELVKLYGAMELAPKLALADCIVDIVDTGNTLKANGMRPDELIAEVSSRLVVNRAAMKCKFAELDNLIGKIRKAVETSA